MSENQNQSENSSKKNQKKIQTISKESPEDRQARAEKIAQTNQRIYKGTQEVDHDLFKLELATMTKNIAIDGSVILEKVEHVHFFHTVDSNGKKQVACAPVGGHHHDIEVIHDPDGGFPTLKVSPPMRWVRKRVRGQMMRVSEPVKIYDNGESDQIIDDHEHKVTYRGSSKIKLRDANPEFAKFEAMVKAKQDISVDGVISG